MVNARKLEMWSISPSMMWGKSPKIHYHCGKCNKYNSTRISVEAIENKKPYVICSYCGEVNDTRLKF